MFYQWINFPNRAVPYDSFGNGFAMRVSPVVLVVNSLEETLILTEICVLVSHNHPKGIRGAQAIAACIYMAKTGYSKQKIKIM